ncbi:MAG: dUTP diphosphatase [Eubacteriales bacterium]|nr:dUTP diphosphatase [Eubacteriales bacterium]
MKMKVRIKKLDTRAILPTYGSPFSAGADLYAVSEENVTFLPGETKFIHTGISMEIPQGYVGLVYARSGMACKRGLAPANKVGVIDADYRGEIMVALHNHSDSEQRIEPGERVAQIVIAPFITAEFEECDELSDTLRGDGGFGSTGKR